jgi:hypothetical protein
LIEHVLAIVGYVHTPVVSVQLSVVHVRPSVHVLFVPHTPPPVHMPQPATLMSSQRVPVRGVQVVVLAAVSQIWHTCPGFTVVFA